MYFIIINEFKNKKYFSFLKLKEKSVSSYLQLHELHTPDSHLSEIRRQPFWGSVISSKKKIKEKEFYKKYCILMPLLFLIQLV